MTVQVFIIFVTLILLLAVGMGAWQWRRAASAPRQHLFREYLLSLGVALLLLAFLFAPAWTAGLSHPAYAVTVLLAPFLIGLGAALLVGVLGGWLIAMPRGVAEVALSLASLCLLGAFFFQPHGLSLALLPMAVIVAGVGVMASARFAGEILISLVLFILMGLVNTGVTTPLLALLPGWVGLILRPVFFLQAGLIVLWSALLAHQAVGSLAAPKSNEAGSEPTEGRLAAGLRLGLSLALLSDLVYTIFWVSLWDHTDNGLGGVWMAITGSFTAIAVGGLLIERNRGWLRWTGALYLGVVSGLIWGAFALGIRLPYLPIQERRADLVDRAILAFYRQNGRYPASLAELMPRQLLWIPRQLILRNEDWCYQGGSDYYRLGVFWRERFSGLLEVKVYASTGSPPEAGWVCQEKLEKMKYKYDPAPLFEGGP